MERFQIILIPGRGNPSPHCAVAMKGGRIDWVGPFAQRRSKHLGIRPISVPVLMPGLWGCHVHFIGMDVAVATSSEPSGFLPGYSALVGAITVDDLKCTLMAGFTSVRELGGFAAHIWPAVRNGPIIGPNIYSSMGPISCTGGHGDNGEVPLQTVKDAIAYGTGQAFGVAGGVDECIKMVITMIRQGARVIKVCSSGGVMSVGDDPEDRQYADEELRAIVQEAGPSRRATGPSPLTLSERLVF